MKIVVTTKDIKYGDVLVTKHGEGKLVKHGVGGCGNCIFRGNGCNLGLIHACPDYSIFEAVEPTEEIEQARDLFTLKGGLL